MTLALTREATEFVSLQRVSHAGLSEATIHRHMRDPRFDTPRPFRIGRRWRFRPADIETTRRHCHGKGQQSCSGVQRGRCSHQLNRDCAQHEV